jgi:hypothetical protein
MNVRKCIGGFVIAVLGLAAFAASVLFFNTPKTISAVFWLILVFGMIQAYFAALPPEFPDLPVNSADVTMLLWSITHRHECIDSIVVELSENLTADQVRQLRRFVVDAREFGI